MYYLTYEYDSSGQIVGFVYSRTTDISLITGERSLSTSTKYTYLKNALGDIVGIIDELGQLKAEYQYDSYGNCTVINHGSTTIGDINPFRYRSYYYDTDEALYYLNNRYYDPTIGRFISKDDIENVDLTSTDINLYVYCKDNPMKYVDEDGEEAVSLAIQLGVVFVLSFLSQIPALMSGRTDLKEALLSSLMSTASYAFGWYIWKIGKLVTLYCFLKKLITFGEILNSSNRLLYTSIFSIPLMDLVVILIGVTFFCLYKAIYYIKNDVSSLKNNVDPRKIYKIVAYVYWLMPLMLLLSIICFIYILDVPYGFLKYYICLFISFLISSIVYYVIYFSQKSKGNI